MTASERSVDSLVLDLDGVLVDVSDSYRRAIVDTIDHVYGFDVGDEDVQRLKDAGGFNNDWDVTYALALLELVKDRHPDFDVDGWYESIRQGSGGLGAARTAIEDRFSSEELEKFFEKWDRERLRGIFQELYLGSELYERLEGGSSELEAHGYINDETVLLDEGLRERLLENFSVGVLTGRPRAEAFIALERVGLELPENVLIAMEDWEHSKPHSKGLLRLSREFDSAALVFVGDTLDDVRTARNADEEDEDCRYFGVGVLTGGLSGTEGRQKFEQAGSTAVLDSVNDLPDFLECDFTVP